MPTTAVSLIITEIVAYLWGSLPSGYWMGILLRGREFDIRQYGSHKIGATNVQRTLGTFPALIVFILDLSKGIGPALLATHVPFFQGEGWGILVAGLAALLGHRFPIFIHFRGGRSVLTASGTILIISPPAILIAAIVCLLTIGISRYVSLGSLVGCLTVFVCGITFYIIGITHPGFVGQVTLPQMLYLVIATILVTIFHSDNISRLLKGTERKLSWKSSTNPGIHGIKSQSQL